MAKSTDVPVAAPEQTTRQIAIAAGAIPRKRKRALPSAVAAVAGVAIVAVAWQVATMVFPIPQYILPSPLQILQSFLANLDLIARHIGPTTIEAIAGYLIGNVVAILLAVLFVHWRSAEQAVMPLAIILNTVPIVAIAPIIVIAMGNGYSSKITVAALICFFPTLVNMVKGLNSVDRQQLELFRILSASKPEVLFKVRAYAALPFLFSALKITATSAFIGAIIAEWLGAQVGLGYLIIQTTYSYDTALLFVVMFVASGLSILFYFLVGLVERLVVRWKPENDD